MEMQLVLKDIIIKFLDNFFTESMKSCLQCFQFIINKKAKLIWNLSKLFSLKEKEVNEIISKTIKENQKRQSNSNNCSWRRRSRKF